MNEIGQKAYNNTTSRPSVPCISQILTTFYSYSGRPRMCLQVSNKQKVRQAMVKIRPDMFSQNGLTIGGLIKIFTFLPLFWRAI